jgi:hypothetical protein
MAFLLAEFIALLVTLALWRFFSGCSIRQWSISFLNETKAARPKSGRPLQMQPVQWRHGFVEASPSRVLRDGEGMLRFKLTHYLPTLSGINEV